MDWVISPIGHYVLLTLGIAACLYQFVTLKREVYRERQKGAEERRKLEEALARMRSELDALRENPPGAEEPVIPFSQSMNLSKRSRVLRMHRRGSRPDQIAAALSLPRNEVDLLLKVHQNVANET